MRLPTKVTFLDSFASTILGIQSYQNELRTKFAVGGYKGLILKASFSAFVGYQKIKKEITTY